ncbi:type 1 fimbrial protein [Escherichia coli]|nr:type 1 fimbrial protein [Escherichia coli]
MLRKFIFLFVLFTFVNSVRAVDVPVRIYGTIIIPPCEINSGEPVNVDFGNVQEEKINSRTYDKKIIVPVRCPYHQGDVSLTITGTVAKLAMRQPFVLFKGLTFQKLCLPGAFRPGDHHNKMLRPGLCVVHASPQYL